MDALRELENKILEELQDVHDIQRKLVESRLQRGDPFSDKSRAQIGDYSSDNLYFKNSGYGVLQPTASSTNTPKKAKNSQKTPMFRKPAD